MAPKISPKVQELKKKVYNTMLALADPKTGTMQASLLDICAVAGFPERKRDAEYVLKVLQREGKVVVISRHGMAGMLYRLPELVKGDTVTTYQQPVGGTTIEKRSDEIRVTPLPEPKTARDETPGEPINTPEPAPATNPVPKNEEVLIAAQHLEELLEDDADVLNILLKSYYHLRKRSQALIKAVKEQE